MANRKKVSKKQGDKGGPGKNGLRPAKKGKQPRNGRNRRGPLPGMEPGYWERQVVRLVESSLSARLRAGEKKYGTLDPAKKGAKDWLRESMEETLDCMVYTLMAHIAVIDTKDLALEALKNGDVEAAKGFLRML